MSEEDKQMSINQQFAKLVYYSRIEKNYTQEELAEKVSISPRYVQKIEKGAMPGGIIFLRLVRALDIDIENLKEV